MDVYKKLDELGIKLSGPTPKRRNLQFRTAIWRSFIICIRNSTSQCSGRKYGGKTGSRIFNS